MANRLKSGCSCRRDDNKESNISSRAVMEKSKHVLLIDGVLKNLPKTKGLDIVPTSYYLYQTTLGGISESP